MIYLEITLIIILCLYIFRLWQINKSLNKQEAYIINLFNSRTNMIPAVFDITQNHFTKHKDIFENVLKYRKQELYKYYIQNEVDNINSEFLKLLYLEELIHHELNFIFRIANKHPKLIKKGNFIYLRDLIINKSAKIGEELKNYKNRTKLYNKLVLFPIFKKNTL